MAQTVCVIVRASDRGQLEAIASDRNRPRKHAERARVVLASVDGDPVQRVTARLAVSRPMVWRWQQRFAEEGVDGLLRDKTRKPGKPPIAAETVARVVALTCADPPHKATHWTGRAMAKAAGLSEISCAEGHDGREGDSAWPDARTRVFRTRCWISCWGAPIRRRHSTRMACRMS
jgi:transposase